MLSVLLLAPLLANPAHAEVNPCQAFGFFMQSGPAWKNEFHTTLTHYQSRLEGKLGTEKVYYQQLVDRLLDCYLQRAEKTGADFEAALPVADESKLDAYDRLLSKLRAYPRGLESADPIYQASARIAHPGYSREDYEALKKTYPMLETFFDGAEPVAKRRVSETDAALSHLLDFFATGYPRLTYMRDRRVWRALFEENFASRLQGFDDRGFKHTPAQAFELAYQDTIDSLSGELKQLRARFDDAIIQNLEIKILLNRADLFDHLLFNGIFRRDLLQFAWERFSKSADLMVGYADPAHQWTVWYQKLLLKEQEIQAAMRDGRRQIQNPIEEKIRSSIVSKSKSPFPMLVTETGGPGRMMPSEDQSYIQLELARAQIHHASIDKQRIFEKFLNPNFQNAETLAQVIRILRAYSAIAGDDLFKNAVKTVYARGSDANLLRMIEASPYARTSGKTGAALAAEVAAGLAEFSTIDEHRLNAEAYRRLITAAVQDLSPKSGAETIAGIATTFAQAYNAQHPMDFLRLDSFYQDQLKLAKEKLGYPLEKNFARAYRKEKWKDCSLIFNPVRAAMLLMNLPTK